MISIKRFENNKFKTNEIAIFVTLKQTAENASKNALLPAVLRRGSKNYKTQLDISKKLEDMYGASFNCGVDKTGDYIVLKFYMETINNEYSDKKENLAQEALDLLADIVFNPNVENNEFNREYVKQEKDNLAKLINSKKDDKGNYAYQRCIEEMLENDPYGIYKYGSLEELEKIDEKNLYEYYLDVLKNSQVNIYINGKNAKSIEINKEANPNFKEVSERTENGKENLKINSQDAKIKLQGKSENEENEICNNIEKNKTTKNNSEESTDLDVTIENIDGKKIVKEKLDVTQGKLIIGLNVPSENKYAVTLYNTILGGGANSKLFQNVREKASLAYYASSRYIRRKDAIIIRTGIELPNYDKAVKVIEDQIEDMKNGKISDFEITSARTLISSSLKLIQESQDDIMAFDFDQELFNENLSFDEYYKKLEAVTLEEVIEVAKKVKTNTIYYLEK